MPDHPPEPGKWIEVDGRRVLVYSLEAAARIMGCNSMTLRYVVASGAAPAPTVAYGARRYYREEQLEALRRFVAVRGDRHSYPRREDLAQELGVALGTLVYREQLGQVPPPSIALSRCGRCYTPAEAAEVRAFYHSLHSARKRFVRLRPYLRSIGARPREIEFIAHTPPQPAWIFGDPPRGRFYRKADLKRALDELRQMRRRKGGRAGPRQ